MRRFAGMGLEMVQLVMEAEDEFGISITDLEAERARTVGDFYDIVLRLVRETGPDALRQRDNLDTYLWQRLATLVAKLGGTRIEDIQRSTRFIEDLAYG